MPCDEGISQAKGPRAPGPPTPPACRAAGSLAEEQREALEVPLTLVTPRSVLVAIRAELALGTVEAILANARSVAAEAVCALGAEAGPGLSGRHLPAPKGVPDRFAA